MALRMPFRSIQRVYFDDLDALNILHNVRFLLFTERARGELFNALGFRWEDDLAKNPDKYHVVAAHQIDYRSPVRGEGELSVEIQPTHLGTSSCVLGARVRSLHGDVMHAEGTTRLVRLDPSTQRPCPWSDRFRAAFAPLVVAVAALACLGCEQKKVEGTAPTASVPPAGAASVAAMLGIDAGPLDTADPPAPAGDLKAELDKFVNVDTCVKERANLDPLVGDALRAIGYDTFLRDACRLLEAAKDKKKETCERIDSSALRIRCQSWVAMIAQTPEQCPLRFEGVPTRGRVVTCIAVAGKDPRLCTGEARTAERATCDALASRDETKCDALVPADRPACKRELVRWRSLLGDPLSGLAKLPAPKGKLVVKGEGDTKSPTTPEADLSTEFARGAVVVTSQTRARVELGMLGESETTRIAPSPNRRPRLGVAILFEPGATTTDAPKPVLERLELEVPGEATLVHPGSARCDCKIVSARADRTRGGDVTLTLSGTISQATRSYKIEIDLATFVRDVVSEQGATGGPRSIPPLHPGVGLFAHDAGR